jgi:hypothetical protein
MAQFTGILSRDYEKASRPKFTGDHRYVNAHNSRNRRYCGAELRAANFNQFVTNEIFAVQWKSGTALSLTCPFAWIRIT